ncbi:MAG: hypothetical protein RSB10_02680 [Clostridia bacterium]
MEQTKLDLKKVFICGGTGFLGFYSAKEFLKQGVKVGTMALPKEITLDQSWWPQEIDVQTGFLFNLKKMRNQLTDADKAQLVTHEQKVEMFKGYDCMVYAVGPDDRVHTPTGISAYDYFHEKLVTEVVDTFEAAKEAGVKKAIVLNSYFAYFERVMPEKHLAERHPYIKVRGEQSEALIAVGNGGAANGGMDVVVLELPYIFGSMPERTPLWKEVFLDRFAKMPAVFFPKGGTNMIHVNGIAEAVVAAAYYGCHGDKLPVGNEDRKYKYMINKIMETIGCTKKYMGVPCWVATIGGKMVANGLKKENQDSGLNYNYLMKDIQSQDLYNAEACAQTREHLHYSEFGYNGGGSLDDGIMKTAMACYPHRFDKNGKLIDKWIGVNPIKKETATNNVFVNKEKKA